MSEDTTPKTEPYITIARGDEEHGYKYINLYGPGSPRQGQPLSPLLAHEKPEYDSEADAKKALEERQQIEAGGPPAKDAGDVKEEKPADEEKPKGWIRRKKEDE